MSGGDVVRCVVLALSFVVCAILTQEAVGPPGKDHELQLLHVFLRLFTLCASLSAFSHVSFWREQADILRKLDQKLNQKARSDNALLLRASRSCPVTVASIRTFCIMTCIVVSTIWHTVLRSRRLPTKWEAEFTIHILSTAPVFCVSYFLLSIRNRYKILKRAHIPSEVMSVNDGLLEEGKKDLQKLNRMVKRLNKKIDFVLLCAVSELFVSSLHHVLVGFENYSRLEGVSSVLPQLLGFVSTTSTFLLFLYSCSRLSRAARAATLQNEAAAVTIYGAFRVDLHLFYYFLRAIVLMTILLTARNDRT